MSAYLARQLACCQPSFFLVLAGQTHSFHSDLLILAYRKMECFQCRCSSPSLSSQCIACSLDVLLTEEEQKLLKTKPRDLIEEDQRRRKALKERLRIVGRSPGTRARDNEKKLKRRVARVAGLSPQARSTELKSKAERVALQRAGMSRREHGQVLQ